MGQLKYIIENSQNPYAQYLAASGLKLLLTDNWLKIPINEKAAIKNYLVNYLKEGSIVQN